MVVDSRSKMNSMLLGGINIASLLTYAQQVEDDKLRENAKEKNKSMTGNYDYFQQRRIVSIARSISRNFHPQPLHQLVSIPQVP